MGKLAATISVTAIAAAALMAAPSGAGAATTIGETFTPAPTCSANITRLQTESPGGQYSAPTDGVITRWSFQAGAPPNPQLKFKVGRATGNTNEFTIIGQSVVVVPVANTLNSYFVQIPVQAGDIIGSFTPTSGNCRRGIAGYNYRLITGDVQPPTTAVFGSQVTGFQLDLSAVLEPDCDNDGLGDETQDTDLSTCAAPGPSTGPVLGPGGTPVFCKGKAATIVGTAGSDVRTGTKGRDVIAGLGGNDTLRGAAGNDLICGGAGNDTLVGGKGKDKLYGQKGKDLLKGKAGKDLCVGGPGKDTAKTCEKTKSI